MEVFERAVQSCTEYMRVMRYVMPVTKAMERVMAVMQLEWTQTVDAIYCLTYQRQVVHSSKD